MKKNKSYRELIRFPTFEERFIYLNSRKQIGNPTFGVERFLNQSFYRSKEWKHARRQAIIRDEGCDLGIKDRQIFERLIVHHINPITIDNIERGDDCIFDLDNLICASHNTHNAIEFGDESLLLRLPQARTKGDTTLWTRAF